MNYVIEDNYLDGRGTNYTIYAPRTSKRNGTVNRNRMLRVATATRRASGSA